VNDAKLGETLRPSAGDRDVQVAAISYHYAEPSGGANVQLALETESGPFAVELSCGTLAGSEESGARRCDGFA
jgi:hypothetical protein